MPDGGTGAYRGVLAAALDAWLSHALTHYAGFLPIEGMLLDVRNAAPTQLRASPSAHALSEPLHYAPSIQAGLRLTGSLDVHIDVRIQGRGFRASAPHFSPLSLLCDEARDELERSGRVDLGSPRLYSRYDPELDGSICTLVRLLPELRIVRVIALSTSPPTAAELEECAAIIDGDLDARRAARFAGGHDLTTASGHTRWWGETRGLWCGEPPTLFCTVACVDDGCWSVVPASCLWPLSSVRPTRCSSALPVQKAVDSLVRLLGTHPPLDGLRISMQPSPLEDGPMVAEPPDRGLSFVSAASLLRQAAGGPDATSPTRPKTQKIQQRQRQQQRQQQQQQRQRFSTSPDWLDPSLQPRLASRPSPSIRPPLPPSPPTSPEPDRPAYRISPADVPLARHKLTGVPSIPAWARKHLGSTPSPAASAARALPPSANRSLGAGRGAAKPAGRGPGVATAPSAARVAQRAAPSPSVGALPGEEELRKLSVAQLKEWARQLDLRVGGNKGELVARLVEHAPRSSPPEAVADQASPVAPRRPALPPHQHQQAPPQTPTHRQPQQQQQQRARPLPSQSESQHQPTPQPPPAPQPPPRPRPAPPKLPQQTLHATPRHAPRAPPPQQQQPNQRQLGTPCPAPSARKRVHFSPAPPEERQYLAQPMPRAPPVSVTKKRKVS